MNTRQAKKIQCAPCDPALKPSLTTPYTGAQHAEAARVYLRAIRRGSTFKIKWSATRPHVARARWRPGFNGAHFYGPERMKPS